MDQLSLTRPDDWHLHLRDGAVLRHTVADAARCFGRALVMPNLRPPVTNAEMALAYRKRILAAIPPGSTFQPLMTLYLTDATTAAEIHEAKESGHILGAKLYPAGATTHSEAGVTAIDCLDTALEAMVAVDLPLQVHGEVTDPSVDVFDREAVFVEELLAPLVERHPNLRVVLEHVSSAAGVNFVRSAQGRVAATITAHHLLYTRSDMLSGGIDPHLYCLPVLKSDRDREALISAATSADPRFFLGTDSAPHARQKKEAAPSCAGAYTARTALELYAEVFEAAGALSKLEAFASLHGAKFYGLEPNPDQVILRRAEQQIPSELPFGDATVVPVRAGQSVAWTLAAG